MNIVIKAGNESGGDPKLRFVKLMIGTAAGFLATAVAEGLVGKFLAKNETAPTTES